MTEKPRVFKVLGASGEAIHGGSGTWLLPQGDEPGGWMPTIKGRLKACELGYHLTPKPSDFYIPGSRVFEAEWQGDVDDNQLEMAGSPKIAVRECRLLREVFDGEHEINEGRAVAYDSASVTAYDSVSVRASGSASVISTVYHSASAVVALEAMAAHIDRRHGTVVLRGARGGELEIPQS